jgi:hypothetical protein
MGGRTSFQRGELLSTLQQVRSWSETNNSGGGRMKNTLVAPIIVVILSAVIHAVNGSEDWFSMAFLACMLICAYVISATIESKK